MPTQKFVLLMCSFVFYILLGAILPFLPLYFKTLGFTNLQLGILYAIGPVTSIFAVLLWGSLSDKLQTIKKLLVVIFIGQLLFIYLVGTASHFETLVSIMFGFYFFNSGVIPLNDSMVLIHIRKNGGNYASFRIYASLGFGLAATVFGAVIAKYGIDMMLWLSAGAILLAVLTVSFMQERGSQRGQLRFSDFVPILASKKFLVLLASIFAVSIGHRMNDAFVPIVVQGISQSEFVVGLSLTTSALFEIPVFLCLIKWGHKFRENSLLMTAAVIYTVRNLIISMTDSLAVIIALQALQSAAFGVYLYAAIALLSKMVPEQFRATGQAIFAFVWSGLAGLSAGTLGGLLLDLNGHSLMYGVAALFSALGLVGFFLLHRLTSKHGIS